MKKRIISFVLVCVMLMSTISGTGVIDAYADVTTGQIEDFLWTKDSINAILDKNVIYNNSDFDFIKEIPSISFKERGINVDSVRTELSIVEATPEQNGELVLTVYASCYGLNEKWVYNKVIYYNNDNVKYQYIHIGDIQLDVRNPYWVNGATSSSSTMPAGGYNDCSYTGWCCRGEGNRRIPAASFPGSWGSGWHCHPGKVPLPP